MTATSNEGLRRAGKDAAAAHLERLGCTIVARDHQTGFGELDLIALDGEWLVFCTVEASRAGDAPRGRELAKGQRVRQMAAAWLAETVDRPRAAELRFDAIAVAFDARGQLIALDHMEGDEL